MSINMYEILKNDSIINNIVVSREIVDNNIYQCKMEVETIVKYVYNEHNEAFNLNRSSSNAPKCKCIFTLHTDRKSSYVKVQDRHGNEIFTGNSLWGSRKHKSYEKHVEFIKLLHSLDDVKEKYSC